MKTVLYTAAGLLILMSFTMLRDKGLKDHYASYFPIGVAVAPNSIKGEEMKFVVTHFNSITPENAMKMGPIHPQINKYFWRDADSIVSFGVKNGMRIRGHALLWHEQTPPWIFKQAGGDKVSKDTLYNRLRSHIDHVVGRYKGKIYAWDVVNEAIDDNPDNLVRNSDWYTIGGEEIIAQAFHYAHAADPDAKLFYNDYNTEIPHKRDRIYILLKKLLDAKVPVHGIGLQGHWSIFEPSAKELDEAITKFKSLGLEIQITEMDMSVYPWEKEKRNIREDDQVSFTPELEARQAKRYGEMFEVIRKHKEAVTGVTFWNISDRHSWLDQYPVNGRKNYPLLFDQNLKPKKAFWEVVKF